jgi:hypothetical protein
VAISRDPCASPGVRTTENPEVPGKPRDALRGHFPYALCGTAIVDQMRSTIGLDNTHRLFDAAMLQSTRSHML